MAFEIYVVDTIPMNDVEDIDVVALRFMEDVGYIMKHYDPKTPTSSVRRSVPVSLFIDCLLKDQDKDWKVEELGTRLKTSIPTIYRHLSKLKAMGIMDEEPDQGGKVFHFKHYSFSLAWMITEANVEAALVRYKKIVDHIQAMLKKGERIKDAKVSEAPKSFKIRVRGSRIRIKGVVDDILPSFLEDVDYLSDQGPSGGDPSKSLAYRLIRTCFLARPDKFWDVDELRIKLKTTRPTIYRHLNKLEAMGLMEKKQIGRSVPPKRAHRIRYGNLSRAWSFVEEYARVAMENYRSTVDHLDELTNG